MHFYILPGARRVTISNGGGCFWEVMKVKGPARRFSYRSVLPTVFILGMLLPFLFIRAAFLALEATTGPTNCSSINCIGRRFGSGIFGGDGPSTRLANELTRALLGSKGEASDDERVGSSLQSFEDLVADVTSKPHDIGTFVVKAKAVLLKMERRVKFAKLQGSVYRQLASMGVPKSIHCLLLRLAEEYSVNSLARSPLPPPEIVSCLTNRYYYHLAILSDNVLAAGVVVASAVRNSDRPEQMVFHVVTDKKTYAPMHAWFALNPVAPAVVEVKGLHQYDWHVDMNIGVMQMVEIHRAIQNYYYHKGSKDEDGVHWRLEAMRPASVSLLNHLRIFLPELFPELDKILFLDDDVVVQHDLSPLWSLQLNGKVNGAAVSSWKGEGSERRYCPGKTYGDYLNFSDPRIVASELQQNKCAWQYGMNIFDLQAWRQTSITNTYQRWLKLNLDSGFKLWRLGALPPSLIAFSNQVELINPMWHISGLGDQVPNMDRTMLEAAAVVHFSGPAKPWLPIGFPELQSLWNIHVNYTNELIKSCGIME